MQEYEIDDEFAWEDPKKVDKKNESLCQMYFCQSEHEGTLFTTDSMKEMFDWSTSTEEAEEVLQGIYKDDENKEVREIMKLVLNNCVQITP